MGIEAPLPLSDIAHDDKKEGQEEEVDHDDEQVPAIEAAAAKFGDGAPEGGEDTPEPLPLLTGTQEDTEPPRGASVEVPAPAGAIVDPTEDKEALKLKDSNNHQMGDTKTNTPVTGQSYKASMVHVAQLSCFFCYNHRFTPPCLSTCLSI